MFCGIFSVGDYLQRFSFGRDLLRFCFELWAFLDGQLSTFLLSGVDIVEDRSAAKAQDKVTFLISRPHHGNTFALLSFLVIFSLGDWYNYASPLADCPFMTFVFAYIEFPCICIQLTGQLLPHPLPSIVVNLAPQSGCFYSKPNPVNSKAIH